MSGESHPQINPETDEHEPAEELEAGGVSNMKSKFSRDIKRQFFRLYSPPASGPVPQLPAPPELVRAGAVPREERYLRGDYDVYEEEAVQRALARIATESDER